MISSTAIARAAPEIPANDAVVVERLPPSTHRLRATKKGFANKSGDLKAALDLCWDHLEASRRDGDPRHFGRIEALLFPWWKHDTPPAQSLLVRALVRQAKHDLAGAMRDLDRVLATDRRSAQAWLTKAVVMRVQGDAAGSYQSCVPLLRLADPLVASTCIAMAKAQLGEALRSYDELLRALQSHPSAPVSHQIEAHKALASIAEQLGRIGDPDAHYRDAIKLGARDTHFVQTYADFLADRHRYDEIKELLKSFNHLDSHLLRLALAQRRTADPTFADSARTLRARLVESRDRSEVRHLRTEARFALSIEDNPEEALELALQNWAHQKELRDARLLLEAAVSAERSTAATLVLQWIERTGVEDVRLDPLVGRITGSSQ